MDRGAIAGLMVMWVGRYSRSYGNVGGGDIADLMVMWVGEI